MSIKILLADDHEIVRFGLASLIEEQKDMEVAGEAENGRDAISRVQKLQPNVVIMDIAMPDMNGIEAARRIHKEYPNISIIILSMYYKKKFIIDALQAGVAGYILKTKVYDDLILAIKAASAGEVYLSSKIAAIVAHDIVGGLPVHEKSVYTVLTPREREILQLIAEGKSTKQSAFHLKISIKTVESARRQIMQKLDIHNIADLTKYAISEGLTTLDF